MRGAALPTIVHETERLTLRALRAEDEEEFVRLVRESQDAWRPWVPAGRRGATAEDRFRRELDRAVRGARAGTHLRLAAFERTDAPARVDASGRTDAEEPTDMHDPAKIPGSAMVGLFALNEIVRGVFQSAYASWQVGAGHMGRGLGTEGVRGLLDVAFHADPDGLGLHRVQANIMPSNAASLRIARKLGFRREGLAARYLKIAGRWEDHVMLALTREEWSPEGT